MTTKNTRIKRQRPRDDTGRQRRTLHLKDDKWWAIDATRPAAANTALEAAMRPYLDDLTIPQRDAVRAVFFAGLSEREAAESLGISRDSVRDRITGATRKLRKALIEASGVDTFAGVMQWLTPSVKIVQRGDAVGTVDMWRTAACVDCGENLAQYRPNSLGLLPKLKHIVH